MYLREVNFDTLVSTVTRRGRPQCDRLVILRRRKQGYFYEKATPVSAGFEPGAYACLAMMQSGALPERHVPFSINMALFPNG